MARRLILCCCIFGLALALPAPQSEQSTEYDLTTESYDDNYDSGEESANCTYLGRPCGLTERCNSCGEKCEETCDGHHVKCPLINFCPEKSAEGVCECLPGFARNSDQECVLAVNCRHGSHQTVRKYPQHLGGGQHHFLLKDDENFSPSDISPDQNCSRNADCINGERCNVCGPRCEETCGRHHSSCPLINVCVDDLSPDAWGVCECVPGFARDANGNCVLPMACEGSLVLQKPQYQPQAEPDSASIDKFSSLIAFVLYLCIV
ncbi:unnamed protein product, partial [Mesorhabditis spiculigera]